MVLAKACKGVLLYTFTCANKCLFMLLYGLAMQFRYLDLLLLFYHRVD